MKPRKSLPIFGLMLFISVVSYTIVEPEIWGEDLRKKQEEEMADLRIRDLIEGKGNFQSYNHTNESSKITTDRIIAELVKKYKLDFQYPLKESPWTIAKNWVSLRHVYPEETPELGAILHSMVTKNITQADVGYGGTQLKMTLVLEGGQKAVFKPKRFSRDHVIEDVPYGGEDRHNGEVAAFHLSRLLDLRRTPLVVGHVVDMVTDIKPIASQRLKDTFYKRADNLCFYGKCFSCKGKDTGVCGEGTKLEGALVLWLPDHMKMKKIVHPWTRTYKENILAKWEKDNNYCQNTVLKSQQYNTGPRLMDIIDACVLDYLIGNADRHSCEYITDDPSAMLVMLDNSKSFGNPFQDERSILAPLYQCCRIRERTWSRLLILQDGVLSAVLRTMLEQDPIAPVLANLHYKALDRRLKHVLTTIEECKVMHGVDKVMMERQP